jgi:hypothetical protein
MFNWFLIELGIKDCIDSWKFELMPFCTSDMFLHGVFAEYLFFTMKIVGAL